ncbi:MAG: hypothetical protein WCX86_05340 [Candidatus Hydrogenedentales bacterium]
MSYVRRYEEYTVNKRAVHFGAGSIGRGFLGQIYCESGYETIFIDVERSVVDALNERNAYPLYEVSDAGTRKLFMERMHAVDGNDMEAAAVALAASDIASTAVGLRALPHIAPIIATAVEKRFRRYDAPPMNIIICENIKGGERYLRSLVASHLSKTDQVLLEKYVGFVEASIGRMVPVMTEEQRAEDPLSVYVEPYCELPVDAHGFRGVIPELVHLQPTTHFEAYVERKLFVHNLTHAATAYVGYHRGYRYIYEAIRDPEVHALVEAAGLESCAALAKKFDMEPEALEAHRRDLIHRYHNRALADQVDRVGRDPKRKLSPEDRLIGAMHLCLDHDIEPKAIASVTGAAILYNNPDDPSAVEIQELLREKGVDEVLTKICGLSPDSRAATLIRNAVQSLEHDTKEA